MIFVLFSCITLALWEKAGDAFRSALSSHHALLRREFRRHGGQEVKEAGLDREDLLGVYRNMLVTRGIEERGHILYKQGKIPGSFYTGRGNEAAAVGVATAMGPNDVGCPTQRDMGVHITRGSEPWRVFAQYMGRVDGPTKGRDGAIALIMNAHDGRSSANWR